MRKDLKINRPQIPSYYMMTKDCSNFNHFTIELNNKNDTPEEVKELLELDINAISSNDALLAIKKKGTTIKRSVDEMIPVELDNYLVNTKRLLCDLKLNDYMTIILNC